MPKGNTKKKCKPASKPNNPVLTVSSSGQSEAVPVKPRSWSIKDLAPVVPLTDNQRLMFDAYLKRNKFLAALGSPGVGKTFLALYLGMLDVLDKSSPITHVRIVRSPVQGREMGHMPGDNDDKMGHYSGPYRSAIKTLFKNKANFDQLVEAGLIVFDGTSFNRGANWDDCVVIVDEVQNMNWHEINTACTRLGVTSKIILCGDKIQCDLAKKNDVTGIDKFIRVIEGMSEFELIRFTKEDCVRSGFVKSWLHRCEKLGLYD